MKYLMLLFLVSCATNKPRCTMVENQDFLGLKYVRYSCNDGVSKVCRFNLDDGRSLGCFAARLP